MSVDVKSIASQGLWSAGAGGTAVDVKAVATWGLWSGGVADIQPCGPTDVTRTVSGEFDRCMVFDLRRGAIFPGVGYPLTCAMRNAPLCEAGDRTRGQIVAGAADGRLVRAFSDGAHGLGTPTSKVRWTVAANSSQAMLYIDPAAEESFFPATYLKGLPVWVRQASTGTFAYSTIYTNSKSAIYLEAGQELPFTPTPGDWLWVAPMTCGVLWPETRYDYPATTRAIRLNVAAPDMGDLPFTIGIYRADGDNVTLDLTKSPKVSQRFTTEKLRRGTGRLGLPATSGRALALALNFTPTGGGQLHIGPIEIEEILHPSENYRSA